MPKRPWMIFAIILAILAATAVPALCHKVVVFAWTEEGKIHVEGGFGGKRPARDCRVTLEDDQGNVVSEGRTDDQGTLSFDMPEGKFSSLNVVLEAGTGHKGSWTLGEEDLKQGAVSSEGDSSEQATPEKTRPRALTQGPSPLKIGLGIGLIFAAALLGRRFFRKKETR